ncbi:MAG: DUF1932 domain-containing protein [Anaerolineales bacterium]|nr:DUF1932 domain-containing protein [Anaerolineales bacterium]
MTSMKLGILHPGSMGISIAASAQNSNCEVFWASEGRSQQTFDRAAEFNLRDTTTLAALCKICSTIVCVCPPHAAEEVADQVIASGFKGLYLDANAISPGRAIRIGQKMTHAGASFVDGGIIGGPAWEPNSTFLHLSGPDAQDAASYFSAGPLETRNIGVEIGKASAIKMCFAAYTKGRTALLCAIVAASESLDVREELFEQWSQYWPEFAEETTQRIIGVTAKAWRFEGEMFEISTTFEEAGVPGGFHEAAADIYGRLVDFKDAPSPPTFEEVLSALLEDEKS